MEFEEQFVMKTKKLPKMDEKEILQLIKKQSLCRIAFRGNSYPYISPFQYVVIDGILYFHFTDYGKKIAFLRQDTPVCVEIEKYSQDFSKFAFVILQGKLKPVDDSIEKNMVLEKFSTEGKKNFSENFLLAHGLSSGSKWEDLTEKPLIIVKLDKVVKKTGLKSDNYEN
jgi:nitroimidazol reductase NimA-like FMN-containing flavoprotein (pyridoxamine 5'-phosphate oxidase superfamily)